MKTAEATRRFTDNLKNAEWWRENEVYWETSTWLPAESNLKPLTQGGAFKYISNRTVSFGTDGFPTKPIQPLWLHKSVFFPHRHAQVQPSRLLDVHNIAIVQPHQYVSEFGFLSRGYMAISHTWYNPATSGLPAPFWNTHIPGCEWELNGSGPNKISAIIDIARMLGYRYVWMDELCVDQRGVTDKREEVPRMKSYYEGATIGLIMLEGNFIMVPHKSCETASKPPCPLGMTMDDEENNGKESNRTYDMRRHVYMQYTHGDEIQAEGRHAHAWLHRTWTLQEPQLLPGSLVLFQDVLVSGALLGDYESGMQWHAGGRVEKANSSLLISRTFGGYRYHTNPAFRRASQQPRSPICPRELITEALKRTRRLDHDIVYGIAGLVAGAENIPIDYTAPVATLVAKLFEVALRVCPRVILWSGASPCEEPGYGWAPGENYLNLVFLGPSCGKSGCVDEKWLEPACKTVHQPIKFLTLSTMQLPTTRYSKLRMAKTAGLLLPTGPQLEEEQYLAYACHFVPFDDLPGRKAFEHTARTSFPTSCDLCKESNDSCSCLSYINLKLDRIPRSIEFMELERRGNNKVLRRATWDLEFRFKSRSGEGRATSDQLMRWLKDIWDIKILDVEF